MERQTAAFVFYLAEDFVRDHMRCVGGENGCLWADLLASGKNFILNLDALKSGLNDQIGIAQGVIVGREDHVFKDGIRRLFFKDALFSGLGHLGLRLF